MQMRFQKLLGNSTVYITTPEQTKFLKFRLVGKQTDQATYIITFEHGGKTFEKAFSLSPNRHALTCEMQMDGFNLKEFTVSIGTYDQKESLTLKSVVPKDSFDYKSALKALEKNQAKLLDNYRNSDGVFTAEIYARVLVKEGKAYWYIGIASENGNIKALLIDAQKGEVLAIRDVF
jgi:sialic acid synthase SpsE